MRHLRRSAGRFAAAGILAGAALFLADSVSSDQVTLTTYYPAPSGVYTRMITTDQTWLARDGCAVSVGTSASPAFGAKLIVAGGNVGLGTPAPSRQLHVFGGLRLEDGTQAAGRILTADAQGNASWVPPPAGRVYQYTCNASRTNGSHTDTAWCGPALVGASCVPFVVYQNQSDNDQDQVEEAGCLLQGNRLYFSLHTSGDDHENTALGSICGAICGLPLN